MAEAFIIGEEFIGQDKVALVLGDNIFYGTGLTSILLEAVKLDNGAIVFGYPVHNPSSFGVVEFDDQVVEIAKNIKPSARGELEITAVNNEYLRRGQLKVVKFLRGMAWLDTGTYDGLQEASTFVNIIQKRQGLYVSCIEEIAYRRGFIDREQLLQLAEPMLKTEYGQYLKVVAEEKR